MLGLEMRRAWGAVVGWPWLADQPHTATHSPCPQQDERREQKEQKYKNSWVERKKLSYGKSKSGKK